jgi:hypothetical protein
LLTPICTPYHTAFIDASLLLCLLRYLPRVVTCLVGYVLLLVAGTINSNSKKKKKKKSVKINQVFGGMATGTLTLNWGQITHNSSPRFQHWRHYHALLLVHRSCSLCWSFFHFLFFFFFNLTILRTYYSYVWYLCSTNLLIVSSHLENRPSPPPLSQRLSYSSRARHSRGLIGA